MVGGALAARRGLGGHFGHRALSLVAATLPAPIVVARLRLGDLGVPVGVVDDWPRSVLWVEFVLRCDLRPTGRRRGVARMEFVVEHFLVLRCRGGGPTRGPANRRTRAAGRREGRRIRSSE